MCKLNICISVRPLCPSKTFMCELEIYMAVRYLCIT